MEEKNRAFAFARMGEDDGVIAIGVDSADDQGAGRLLDVQALGDDGDAAVRADARLGVCAPDVGPPRAARRGAELVPVSRTSSGLGRLFGERAVAAFAVVEADVRLRQSRLHPAPIGEVPIPLGSERIGRDPKFAGDPLEWLTAAEQQVDGVPPELFLIRALCS